MVSNLTYRDLTDQAVSLEGSKEDFLVPAKQMEMQGDNITVFEDRAYEMNPVAHKQLAGRLKVPTQFYDRMVDYPGLRSQVVNRLLSEDERTFFFRTHGSTGRAFLSDRYKAIDNVDVLTAAAPVLRDMNIQFRSAAITDTRMYLQVTFPKMEAQVAVGDVVQYGLTISNSEVGMGMVRVAPTLWRLICSNGMIRQTEIQHRHVGKQMEMGEDFGIYRDETIKADQVAFRMKLQDTIQMSVEETFFDALIRSAHKAVSQTMDNPVKAVKNITKHFALDGREDDLMNAMSLDIGEPSRWKIANAVTGLAHSTPSIDAQFEYEKIGSQILEMKDAQWISIAA